VSPEFPGIPGIQLSKVSPEFRKTGKHQTKIKPEKSAEGEIFDVRIRRKDCN
jgi:hypothetical protein